MLIQATRLAVPEEIMQRFILSITLTICMAAESLPAFAQAVRVQAPLQSTGTSFYEHSHIGWSVQNPHYFMRFNGGAAPPFGGYQPGAGLSGGFGLGNSQLSFGFGQGASMVSTSAASVLTTTNGFPSDLFAGTERPFVTGIVPVVDGGFAGLNPVGPLQSRVAAGELRLESDGRLAKPILDELGIPPAPPPERALMRDANAPSALKPATGHSAADHFQRGELAEKEHRPGIARIYYQLAATKGDPVIAARSAQRLEALKQAETRPQKVP